MDLILLAAGVGKRSGLSYPKQFFKINGKPIIVYTLEVFSKLDFIEKIIVTCNTEYREETNKIINDYGFTNVVLVDGGRERQDSVRNALRFVNTDSVIIHEAARPFISEIFVQDVYQAFHGNAAIVPVIDVPFSVALSSEGEMVGSLEREHVKNIQLPQIFPTKELVSFHRKALEDSFNATEDSMIFFRYGGKVKFIEGRISNIKVTNDLDIIIANKLMEINNA